MINYEWRRMPGTRLIRSEDKATVCVAKKSSGGWTVASADREDSVQVMSTAAGIVLCWHGTKCPVQMESAPYAAAPLPERIARLQVTCRGTELVIVRDKGEGKIFLNGVACGKIISGVLRSLLSVEAQAEPYLLPIAALLWTAEELERCENV